MQTATLDSLRHQLSDRQERLRKAVSKKTDPEDNLVRLLQQVDTALAKLGGDDYARCLICEEQVTDEDLLKNPLLEYCLCSLTPQQQRALEHDLGLARRIQASLLPDPHLSSSGWQGYYRYEPAGVVSGDYCDLWMRPGDSGTIYFAVGDVSGKGVAASLLMVHLQTAFRSLMEKAAPLSELVDRVNRQLLQSGITTHYATLACGRLNADGEVEMVNAGHCPPLVMRTGRIESIEPTGLPVGLFADRPYEVTRVRLHKGESLVLYTDGLTEAGRSDTDEYGAERLKRMLLQRANGIEPKAIVQMIRDDLAIFLDNAIRSDDLTILAVQRTQ